MSQLGELLVRQNLVSAQQLHRVEEEQRVSGGSFAACLAKLGMVTEAQLTDFLARQYGVASIDVRTLEVSAEILAYVPVEIARKYQVLPVGRSGSSLTVAMSDPSNIPAIDDLKFLTGLDIDVRVAAEGALGDALSRLYQKQVSYQEVLDDIEEGEEIGVLDTAEVVNTLDLERASEEAPVIKLCNVILLNAIKKRASDIHIEPYEKFFRVRYRVDGVLYEEQALPMKLKQALISRIKIMSSLDIAERRLPQDGRIKLRIGKDREMDFRVSVLPTLFGEKIVLRLLDKEALQLDMTKLGFEAAALGDFIRAIHQPFGMVLVTGPTESGKTTTLYSALSELNKVSENISTAEDPVEYNLPGINQVQMNDDIGLNFAAALRSFLRQDPDIIMVGEIRDFETAEIAVKAALTGHMVLSTLHTNDAPSTVTRLLNMGVEPFLVTASVNLILAQRLARRICRDCRAPVEANPQALINLGLKPELAASTQVFRGAGGECRTCSGTGYKGRVALYEVMPFTDGLKEMVLQGASTIELKAEAMRQGMRTLRASGLQKIAEGVTTIEEVGRVTAAD